MNTENKIPPFDYEQAFSRNIGWVTPEEQITLKNKKIAIAGMGGVGGLHLLTQLRLGLSNFHIADFDTFELANFNRQVGATTETIGQPKAQTLKKMAEAINPNAKVELFAEGIDQNSIPDFLEGVDIFVDGLDFFELEARAQIFAACYQRNIPAITAAPLGMGCAHLIFMPNKMSFEEYFRFKNKTYTQQIIRFALGLSPKSPHKHYLILPDKINLKEKRGPSTIMGCQLCSSIAATEVLKILLNRGPIYPAPYFHIFDAYQQYAKRNKLWLGNQNPLQRLKAYWLEKQLK
tara:strand:+ start:145608 stop:146480 length:873 start_codon:yes stop_codon:yes gene_type:complete